MCSRDELERFKKIVEILLNPMTKFKKQKGTIVVIY
jgi:hypothetical protein